MSGLGKRRAKAEAAAAAGYAVRSMEQDDAERVAQVHVGVWRTSYAALLPKDYLASLDVREFAERWSSRLASRSPLMSQLVGLRSDGSIVGLGSAGPPRDPNEPAPRELYGLNVLAEARGTGLADLMMQPLVGEGGCSLWVLDGNTRAIAFYQAYGFRMDGHTKKHPPTRATELRMVRDPTH